MGMMARRNVKARVPHEEVRAVEAAPTPVKEPEIVQNDVTREEVEKMPYFGLKALATKHGIDTEGKKAGTLKAELIDKLNL